MVKKGIFIPICILGTVVGLSTAVVLTLQLSGAVNLLADKAHVEFRNYDNSLLYKTDIPVGTDAVYEGAQPQKESTELYSYKFSSWDKPLTNIVVDTTFYAQYQNYPCEFKVTFQDWDYVTLYEAYVRRGETARYIGKLPFRDPDEKAAYEFNGWDKALENIQEDTVFTAVYDESPVDFKVSFYNYDGTLLYSDYVAYGKTAVYRGLTPSREGTESFDYVFKGWDKALENITATTDTYAVYEKEPTKYTATFLNYDGSELYVDKVAYNKTAEYKAAVPYRAPDSRYSYTFNGWNLPLTNITKDTIFIAQFITEERQYFVNFYNYDDTLVYTTSVKYGRDAYYGGPELTRPMDEKYVYTFAGWDRDISYITEDTTTYAKWDKQLREFTCTFRNFNGEILYTCQVKYGYTAVYKAATPVKKIDLLTAYKFIGWDKELTNITEDTTFIAQFEVYSDSGSASGGYFEITFVNFDDEIVDYDIVTLDDSAEYGDELSYLVRPDDANFYDCEFYGWSRSLDGFTENTTVYALYTYAGGTRCIIQYRDMYGNLICENGVAKGGYTSYSGPSTLDGYNIIGWQTADGVVITSETQIYEPMVLFPILEGGSF